MYNRRNVRRLLTMIVVLVGLVAYSHSVALAQPAKAPLFAVLLGGNEVTDTGQANAGDKNGHGAITVIIDGSDMLCFAIAVNKIDTPIAMHIHQGLAGVNGPVIVPLIPIPGSGSPGTSSGCVQVEAATLRSIRNSSAGAYVNIHTENFPGGALRGQLF